MSKNITIGFLILIIIGGATGLGILAYIIYKIYLWYKNYNPFGPMIEVANSIASNVTKTANTVGSGTQNIANKAISGVKSPFSGRRSLIVTSSIPKIKPNKASSGLKKTGRKLKNIKKIKKIF
jgi:hypothetical protein